MKVFADGDKTFTLGAWHEWRTACLIAGRMINPKEFKNDRNPT